MQIGDELGHPDLAEERAGARIDPDAARRRDPDIAGAVAFHAVGNARLQLGTQPGGEDAIGAERAVGVDVEHADQRPHRVVDVELPLVGRKAQPVRLIEQVAIDEKLRLAAARRHAVDALEAELARPFDAVDRHAPVPRIGKIDRAVGTHADIVRTVELFAFEMRSDGLAPAVALAHQRRGRVLADDEPEIGVIGHAVALVGRLHRFAHAAALIVAAAHVGRHVGEQKILVARVPDRSLGEGKAARQPFDGRVEVDQIGKFATQRGMTHRLPPFLTPGTIAASATTGRSAREPCPAAGRRPVRPRSAPADRAPAARSAKRRRPS